MAADAAARAAGVTTREIAELREFDAVCRLFAEIWRPDPENPLATTELLRALSKAGNYVGGAFNGARLVGASTGFFGAPADATLHSHIAGVAGSGCGVGFALKLHQRAWAMERGASAIKWTFDPLVARNAYFNLVKLGASAVEYLPDFYGRVYDDLNGSGETDRLLIRWDLAAPEVVAACAGTPRPGAAGGAVVALDRSAGGLPVLGSLAGETLLVAAPADIERQRVSDPGGAREWRLAVREVLGKLLGDGARVTGFDKSGWYVVTRRETR